MPKDNAGLAEPPCCCGELLPDLCPGCPRHGHRLDLPTKLHAKLMTEHAKHEGKQAEPPSQPVPREALVAAVPWLFEHGQHQNPQCYRGSDDGCWCGLDEAKKIVEKALAESPSQASTPMPDKTCKDQEAFRAEDRKRKYDSPSQATKEEWARRIAERAIPCIDESWMYETALDIMSGKE